MNLIHRKTVNRIKLKELSKMLTPKLLQNINYQLDLIIWTLKNSEMFWHNEEPQLFSKWLKYIRNSCWFSFRLIYELRLILMSVRQAACLDCSFLRLLWQFGCRSSASINVQWGFITFHRLSSCDRLILVISLGLSLWILQEMWGITIKSEDLLSWVLKIFW